MTFKIVGYSFILCSCLLPLGILVANYTGLVDNPVGRKQHSAPTPIIGGVCIFLAMLCSAAMLPENVISWSMFGWLSIVLAVGVLDDMSDISHRTRLFVHAMVVIGIATSEGLYVSNIGAVTGTVDIKFAVFPLIIFFTMVGVLGAVNAINMSDGLDGLLGTLCIVSLAAVLIVVPEGLGPNYGFMHFIIWSVIGSLACFLCLNSRLFLRRGIVFLGDAGSTVLGFLLVYVVIYYTQGETRAFSPVLAGWILGLPLMDASAVIATRALKGKSPFAADRSHLHHILIDHGYSVGGSVLVLTMLHSLMIAFAVAVLESAITYADAILFWSFVGIVVLRIGLVSRITTAKNAETAKNVDEINVGDTIGVSEMAGIHHAKNMKSSAASKSYEQD